MLLLKSAPFLFLVLPVLLIVVGSLFRATNPLGLLVAILLSLVFLYAGQWVSSYFEWTFMWSFLWFVFQMLIVVWATPWTGFFISVAMSDQNVSSSPAGKSAQKVHAAYSQMSPESQAKVDEFTEFVFRSACKAGSEHLARKGRPNAAAVVDRLSKL